ncbi:MAG TPA: FtsW/RodA/SpoVE family cell cycle protein [Actinomycetota bacterium]
MSVVVERPRRRATGIALLVIALLATLLGYALQSLGLDDALPANLGVTALLVTTVAVGGWLAVRFMARGADPVLYPTTVALAGIGLVMLFRIMNGRGHPEIAQEQAVWVAVGIACFAAVLAVVRDIRQLDAFTYTIGLAGLVLLLLPIVPGLGQEINGARLWVSVGAISFQPAEFGRILIVIFLASYLAQHREMLATGVGRLGLPRVKDLGPLLLAWGTSLVILFVERDLGASLLLFGIFIVMIWMATGRTSYLVIGVLLFAAGAYLGWLTLPHIQERVAAWLHALDPDMVEGAGYQLAQGWFALATGGMVGAGLGLGSPTLIPYVGSDFILAAFGEELGMLGVAALLLLYLVLIGRGLRVAIERQDPFESLLATGLTTLIALQVFVIAGGVLRLIPLTGVPLPLVSYGGTSRVATFVTIALLVRLSAGPWARGRAGGPGAQGGSERRRANVAPGSGGN